MLHKDGVHRQAASKDSTDTADGEGAPLMPKNKLVKRKKKRQKPPLSSVPTSNLLSGLTCDPFDFLAKPFTLPPEFAKARESTAAEKSLPEPDINVRTVSMRRFMLDFKTCYDQTNHLITIDGREHKIISAEVSQFVDAPLPLASCGSSSHREIILLDPDRSPCLQKCYENYRKMLRRELSKKAIEKFNPNHLIDMTNNFMRQFVFTQYGNTVERIEALVSNCLHNPGITKIKMHHQSVEIPCIPIDIFIQEKLGVCRHHAIVAAYLMDRYIHHHAIRCDFIGKIQIMRDNVKDDFGLGAHAWVTLVCKEGDINKSYSLDSLNNLVGRLDDTEFVRLFHQRFGVRASENQLKKAEALRSSVPHLK